ncbi:hypothetical protein [Paenibacillus psychroresistens]|nr:hypothetical protein [Paenibacillus psychroresistens]
MNSTAIKSPEVSAVFMRYSQEETLKWGQLSYLTLKSKSGSTIRIDC